MFPKKIIVLSIALFLGLFSWGQKPFFKDKKVATRVQQTIEYLASDNLRGRLAATEGEKQSAEYIAAKFESIGLLADGEDGYMRSIGVTNLRMTKPSSSLQIGGESLALFTDFYPVSISANNGRYTGNAVNVGHGIVDKGLNHDDYANKDVAGKAVIINLDIPGGPNEHNRFIAWEGIELRAQYAAGKGAIALIFYTTNKDLVPSGELQKTRKHIGKPVVFVNKDLSNTEIEPVQLQLDILLNVASAYNVVGKIENNAQYTVVLAAHYDHLGEGTKTQNPGEIHFGADNNASGVAALLELARELKSKPKKYKNYNYLFVALTGSEQDSRGAKNFISNKSFGSIETNYFINLDMVGHLDSTNKALQVCGVGTSYQWNDIIENTKIWKRKIATISTPFVAPLESDYKTLYQGGMPGLHITTGTQTYTNTPQDKPSVINYGGEAYIIRYITKMIQELDQSDRIVPAKIVTESTVNANASKVLGIYLDAKYAADGILVRAIIPNSNAKNAGILAGDIIIKLGTTAVSDMATYGNALNQIQEITETTVTIVRGNETKTLSLQFL